MKGFKEQFRCVFNDGVVTGWSKTRRPMVELARVSVGRKVEVRWVSEPETLDLDSFTSEAPGD